MREGSTMLNDRSLIRQEVVISTSVLSNVPKHLDLPLPNCMSGASTSSTPDGCGHGVRFVLGFVLVLRFRKP
jgi:hypothetical protein